MLAITSFGLSERSFLKEIDKTSKRRDSKASNNSVLYIRYIFVYRLRKSYSSQLVHNPRTIKHFFTLYLCHLIFINLCSIIFLCIVYINSSNIATLFVSFSFCTRFSTQKVQFTITLHF